jgi:CheY-like chemotaxis protein
VVAPARPVLIIDDDRDHRTAMRELLEDNGYKAVEAANGRQALDFLTGPPTLQPCLLVLDLNMPVMSGTELLAIVKSYLRLATIPVVLVSAHEPPAFDSITRAAVVASLRKPYRTDDLLALVERFGAPAKGGRSD